MSGRLMDLLDDLQNMPGVTGAFLYYREGIIATTIDDPRPQDKVGRIYLNIMSGAFTLGRFVHEVYCDFNNSVVMVRPVGRGCILVAICDAGVSTRLVDISLTMTAKSVEDEINGLEELPPPISLIPAAELPQDSNILDECEAALNGDFNPSEDNRMGQPASDDDESSADADRPAADGMLETQSKG